MDMTIKLYLHYLGHIPRCGEPQTVMVEGIMSNNIYDQKLIGYCNAYVDVMVKLKTSSS